jgi:UDP-N-acetylglucosamine 4,6-dehydratase/UDP-glucose 4-epimerase
MERLNRAFEDVDIVFHAAALKHVPVIEYNPFESIKTNVIGSQNVINACLENDVSKAICIGTDKAVSPLNTYGATKLLMEKLFVSASNYLDKKKHKTKFIALRYGNVLGSSGSVIPKFIEQIKNKQKITITDPNMTRFSITMDDALNFIIHAAELGKGSEIFLPKLRAYTISDVKDALFELLGHTEEEVIGIRSGEKIDEVLISVDEIRHGWEYENMYMITNNSKLSVDDQQVLYPGIKAIQNMETYSSKTAEKIPKEELKNIIKKYNLIS